MKDRIVTDKLEDLVNIFDPKAQELDDAGSARILYTFTEDEDAIRERVGKEFELEVLTPKRFLFHINLPVIGPVQKGVISLLEPDSDLDSYQLTHEGLSQLISDLTSVFGLEDTDAILSLLNDQNN